MSKIKKLLLINIFFFFVAVFLLEVPGSSFRPSNARYIIYVTSIASVVFCVITLVKKMNYFWTIISLIPAIITGIVAYKELVL